MKPQKVFTSMSPEAKVFYHRVFNTAILNIFAVQRGLFDTLFCDTEDPYIQIRWEEALPRIVKHLAELRARGEE